MKCVTFPLSLLALVLALSTAPALASETIPFRFLSTAATVQETDSVARLQVLRADDADHPTHVDCLTQPISATPAADYAPVALAAQSDGKILVATDQNLLVRLNPDGSLDRSFHWMANVPISRIVLDKSGQALISGDFTTVEDKTRPGLARLLSDGSLDPSS